jgi:hypothetical protein
MDFEGFYRDTSRQLLRYCTSTSTRVTCVTATTVTTCELG